MHPQAQQTIVEMFCKVNHVDQAVVSPASAEIIANIEAPFGLFVEMLDPSGLAASANPVDGLLITLIGRLHETVSGALALLSLGRLRQAEVLSRTVMESALSLQYILAEHSGERLVQYFRRYVKTEHDQTRKWENEIFGVAGEWRADHFRRIADKRASLDGYEAFIANFAGTLPPSPVTDTAWPSLYDICSALGKAVDYRTVHMAMCSQVHHDAEDILNAFIVGSSLNGDTRVQELERETGNFSIFLLLCSLRYYLECLGQLGGRYRMPTVLAQSGKSFDAIEAVATAVTVDGFLNPCVDAFLPQA